MTEMTVPMEECYIEALAKLASTVGASSQALARGAIERMVDELSEPPCEPFDTEEEAAEFIEGHARKMMRNAW